MNIEVERSTLAGLITLTLGGIGLGVSLMIEDEIFAEWNTQGGIYYWPWSWWFAGTNALPDWTSWEIAFSMIILSVILLLIGGVVIAINR